MKRGFNNWIVAIAARGATALSDRRREAYGRFALSLAALVAVAFAVDLARVAAILRSVDGQFFGLAVLVAVLQVVINGLRWATVGRGLGVTASLGQYLKTTYVGFFVSQVSPTHLVGEAYRVRSFGRANRWPLVVESIVVERSTLYVIWLAFFLGGLPLTVELLRDGRFDQVVAPLAGAWPAWLGGGLLLCVAASVVFWRKAPLVRAALILRLGELRRARAPGAYLLALLLVASVPVQFYLAGRAVGRSLDFWPLVFLYQLVMIVLSLPAAFGGLGLREAAVTIILSPFLLSPEELVAISLASGAATLIAALPGVFLIALRRPGVGEIAPQPLPAEGSAKKPPRDKLG